MINSLVKISTLLILFWTLLCACKDKVDIITPESGYSWPDNDRAYWPTDEWMTASLESVDLDADKMQRASQFAENDPLSRALLVVKDGFLVYEQYYHGGGINRSTNLWSVTKSFASALVGVLMDRELISSTDQLMKDLMPQYPIFDDITLHHVLTMTTGLSWAEEGPLWEYWIRSDDWVATALKRGQNRPPGKEFFYSSGNSHFLTALVYHMTGQYPGEMAKEQFFDPLGIDFELQDLDLTYHRWTDYTKPFFQSWRKDPQGIECGGFGLYLTARDMAKFGYLFVNRGRWGNEQLLSEDWVIQSTRDQETNIYQRYSYGYQWWITRVNGYPAFLGSGFGGQIIGVIPELDLVVVLKYEAENPIDPVPGTAHDEMHLFDLVAQAVNRPE